MTTSTSRRRRARPLGAAALAATAVGAGALLGGCEGPQSMLDPAGTEAERVVDLFRVMAIGGAVIWTAVIGLAVYAGVVRPREHSGRRSSALILWGGAVFPTVVLGCLLAYGLQMMPQLRAPGDGLRVAVTGEQFWWRVRYRPADGGEVVAANELRLPAGARVELTLDSPDVIHSLWVPAVAGKMDMIPGRTTRLVLEPTRPGTYRGVCAEFCGPSHALMAFAVVVMEPAAFDEWLRGEAGPVSAGAGGEGRELFLASGCGACHTVRGTEAAGVVGPDLTRIGGRRTIAAGILENTQANRARFIAEPEAIKPGVQMPAYGMLPSRDLETIAAWLGELE